MFLRFPIPNLSSYLRPEKIALGYLDIQHLLEKENIQYLKIFGFSNWLDEYFIYS